MQKHSNVNVFQLQVHFHGNKRHFHLNGFAQGLVVKMRQKLTGKWPTILRDIHLFLPQDRPQT